MSIQTKKYKSKKTGKESVRYYAVVFDKETDKLIWSAGFKTQREAKREENRLLEELEQGTHVDSKKLFSAIADEWKEAKRSTYANSTFKGYEWYLEKYLNPVFGDKKMSEIKPIHVQKFITAMNERYSAETVNKCLNLLSVICKFAVDMRLGIKENPCQNISRSKVSNTKHTTWSEDEIVYFLSLPNVRQSKYYDMLILSFTLGIRPSEICGISETDVMQNGILCLNRGYDRYGYTSDLKTESSHRSLELTELLLKLVNKRFTYKKKIRLMNQTDSRFQSNDFLFTNEYGAPMNPNNYSKAFKKLLRTHNRQMEQLEEELGTLPPNHHKLPDIRLYDARHSFATNNILYNRASIKVISEIMGHSNVKTTLHNYAQVVQSMSKKTISDYSDKLLVKVSL